MSGRPSSEETLLHSPNTVYMQTPHSGTEIEFYGMWEAFASGAVMKCVSVNLIINDIGIISKIISSRMKST
uniref:Uncharacterized protein n=1 Tax=Moniliophthora roreri TaxID=221103 RepID=A0A0W0FG58_MONRR